MGLSVRKSVRVGPFRFNLSKSGIGVSAGIKGLRVGTGPRGNYMGRGGFYYRQTLPSNSSAPPIAPPKPVRAPTPVADTPSHTHEPLKEIDSGEIGLMVDSSSQALVDELNTKRKRLRLWPFVAALTVGAFVLGEAAATLGIAYPAHHWRPANGRNVLLGSAEKNDGHALRHRVGIRRCRRAIAYRLRRRSKLSRNLASSGSREGA